MLQIPSNWSGRKTYEKILNKKIFGSAQNANNLDLGYIRQPVSRVAIVRCGFNVFIKQVLRFDIINHKNRFIYSLVLFVANIVKRWRQNKIEQKEGEGQKRKRQ